MPPPPPAATSLMDRLISLSDGFIALLQDRLALVSTELQEEKFRLIQSFLWISAVVCTGLLAITFASLTLVVWFWDTARLAVLGGLTVFYTLALIALVLAFRRFLARQPRPFAASLEEIGHDRACIPTAS